MGIKTIPSNTSKTDNGVLAPGLRRENGARSLAPSLRRSDVNIRDVSSEDSSPTPSFPWKCTRTRRQAICEVREKEFKKNGVTLKHFREYFL
jgi:hypothetical protein